MTVHSVYTKKYALAKRPNITEVVKQLRVRLKGFIRKRVNSEEDAEDVLQDVFYQLAEADQMMKPIEQISAWLYTVARNRITDLYRKKKPESIGDFYSDREDEDILSEIGDILVEDNNSPELEYLKSMIWVEMEKALSELPEEQRSVFEMNELQGMSFKEIAQLTGETENTLISRKHYAVLHLRKRLRELYDDLINF